MQPTRVSRRVLTLGLIVAWAVIALAVPASAAEAQTASSHPGFLDFEELGLVTDSENVKIEINLQDAVLAFMTEALRPSDGELADALSKILSIRFQLISLAPNQRDRATARTRDLAKRLEQQGWQQVVRIQEDHMQSYLHLKMEKSQILGLTVMFINQKDVGGETPEQNFGFINMAGEIDPGQLGRIGQRFDLDVLESAEKQLRGTSSSQDRN